MNPIFHPDESTELDEWPEAAPPSNGTFASIVVFAVVCLAFHWLGRQGWVPILDSANLALHEAGHPLVGLFSSRAMVYGGTFFQLLFPSAFAWHFHRAGNAAGFAASLVWLGGNMYNVARYMADARVRVLPLVGGGEHDWTEIFGRWGVLHLDGRIAGLTRVIGSLLIFWAVFWLFRRWRSGR